MLTVLAIVVPVVFIAGLTARKSPPVVDKVPTPLLDDLPKYRELVHAVEGVTIGDVEYTMRFYGIPSDPTRMALELEPAGQAGVNAPDVLVYWQEGPVDQDSESREGRYLLGRLAGRQARRFALPEPVATAGGQLLFYSLARQEYVGTAVSLPVLHKSGGISS